MPHSQVSEIELSDGNLKLTVEVFGFKKGTLVELSGHATQDNGAIATFYHVQELPKAEPFGGSVVTVLAVRFAEFVPGKVITVAGQARAVKIWGTVLDGYGDPGQAAWRARQEPQ